MSRDLSSDAKALLRAARADAPGSAARSAIWSSVSGAAAGSGVRGGDGRRSRAGNERVQDAPARDAARRAVSVGLAATLLRVTPPLRHTRLRRSRGPRSPTCRRPPRPSRRRQSKSRRRQGSAAGRLRRPKSGRSRSNRSRRASPSPRLPRRPLPSLSPQRLRAPPPRRPPSRVRRWRPEGASRPSIDSRSEASLVAAARAALARGDAPVRSGPLLPRGGLPSPQLEPEELAVEAQALQVLGRTDDSEKAASTARSHPLSRGGARGAPR